MLLTRIDDRYATKAAAAEVTDAATTAAAHREQAFVWIATIIVARMAAAAIAVETFR